MLLVWYKREFEWPDVLWLWKSLSTDWLSIDFHIFIALAILENIVMSSWRIWNTSMRCSNMLCTRLFILGRQSTLSNLLRCQRWLNTMLVNELSNTIDLPSTLVRAQGLFCRFQRTVYAIDKKRNFPAPPVRQRKPVRPEAAHGSSERTILMGRETGSGVPGKEKKSKGGGWCQERRGESHQQSWGDCWVRTSSRLKSDDVVGEVSGNGLHERRRIQLHFIFIPSNAAEERSWFCIGIFGLYLAW